MANGYSGGRLGEWIILGAIAVGVGSGVALTDVDPAVEIHNLIATNDTDSFETAKDELYGVVERDPANNTIHCVYSATVVGVVENNGVFRPISDAGVDAEHTWASAASWVGEEYHYDRDSSVPGADLHNLYPARRGINQSRGNLPFGNLPDDARELFVGDNGQLSGPNPQPSGSFRDTNAAGATVFEPRTDHRGNVARAMFYMSVRYWMPIPDEMEADLRVWNTEDPVDDREESRNDVIQNIQNNRNPFIDDPDLVNEIVDF